MSWDTETALRAGHKTVSRICFGISVTPMFVRQSSSERRSAGFVLASATFSGLGTLLIRTFLWAVSCCSHKNRTFRCRRRRKPDSNGARAVGAQIDADVLTAS